MINNTTNPVLIFLSAFVVNNIVLIRTIGLCSFFSMSNSLKSSLNAAVPIVCVNLAATILSWLFYNLALIPYKLEYLKLVSFVLIIVLLVQIQEFILKKVLANYFSTAGNSLSVITANCIILAVLLLNTEYKLDLVNSIIYSLGIAFGYVLAIILFAGMKERVGSAPIPKALKGYPIEFILAGLMSIAILGLRGLFGL
ncbi:MAG: electron transport complex subunit RsxA [Elusimicrobia bacterium]|nr:electron transport complex subunit RsxA [Elusimicrobiota bacterium]MBU2615240.1 electron transport complex subunit RsxA [Elusimicrobiota bacterium]